MNVQQTLIKTMKIQLMAFINCVYKNKAFKKPMHVNDINKFRQLEWFYDELENDDIDVPKLFHEKINSLEIFNEQKKNSRYKKYKSLDEQKMEKK